MRKFLFIGIGFAFAIAVLVAFGLYNKEDQEPSPEKPIEEEPVQAPVEPALYPLSGTVVDDEGNPVDERPIAVVIENSPEARPQSGLEEADIVFEFLAEGSITRFVALYQSETPPAVVGPVRSARPYFLETAKGYDAFFVAHGYSDTAKALLDDGYIENINGMEYEGVYFERSSERYAPHNSYTSGEMINQAMDDLDIAKTSSIVPEYQFYKDEELASIPGESTNEVTVSYGSSTYDNTFVYDATTGSYTRYVDGEPTTDKETGAPITVENIMVISAPHSYEDNEQNRVIDMSAGGQGYLIQQGKISPIEWQNINGKITPFVNGVEAKLVPGKTWVNVLPSEDFATAVTYTPIP